MPHVGTPQAAASNFGSSGTPGIGGTTSGVWLTNNYLWYVGKRDLTSTYGPAVSGSVNNDYAPTDLDPTVSVASSCPDASYDLSVFDSNYGDNGLNGWNQCAGDTTGSHPNQVCSLGFVKINLFYDPPAAHIACHEMGHSIGLRHTTNDGSCLKQNGPSSALTTHDESQINGHYG